MDLDKEDGLTSLFPMNSESMEEHLSYTDLLNRVATEAAVNKTRYLRKSTDTSVFLSESQSGNAN
jgi:hypothetical protein